MCLSERLGAPFNDAINIWTAAARTIGAELILIGGRKARVLAVIDFGDEVLNVDLSLDLQG